MILAILQFMKTLRLHNVSIHINVRQNRLIKKNATKTLSHSILAGGFKHIPNCMYS